jgi:hypothetical protein
LSISSTIDDYIVSRDGSSAAVADDLSRETVVLVKEEVYMLALGKPISTQTQHPLWGTSGEYRSILMMDDLIGPLSVTCDTVQ